MSLPVSGASGTVSLARLGRRNRGRQARPPVTPSRCSPQEATDVSWAPRDPLAQHPLAPLYICRPPSSHFIQASLQFILRTSQGSSSIPALTCLVRGLFPHSPSFSLNSQVNSVTLIIVVVVVLFCFGPVRQVPLYSSAAAAGWLAVCLSVFVALSAFFRTV